MTTLLNSLSAWDIKVYGQVSILMCEWELSFPYLDVLLSFFILIIFVKTSKTVLNNSGKSRHLSFALLGTSTVESYEGDHLLQIYWNIYQQRIIPNPHKK